MRRLVLEDMLTTEEYEQERGRLRRRIIESKHARRITAGDRISLVFEDRETVQFLVQEIIRAEHLVGEQTREEIEFCNSLIPGVNELSATLFIEITESSRIKEILDDLQGVDDGNAVALRVGALMRDRNKEDEMATLDELMTLQGVVAAGEFTPGGELVDFRSAVGMPSEQAKVTAQFCATVSNLFVTLAEAYTKLHEGLVWVPPKWWVYAGGNMAVCVGGTKGVFVRLGQTDFNRLYQSLVV